MRCEILLAALLVITVSKSTYGQTCKSKDCPQVEIPSRSCLDYLKKGYKENGYYQIMNSGSGRLTTVFCDMTSEPGAAWTLVESFALKNNDLKQFRIHPLQTNAPVNDKTPNWNLYRMSLLQMKALKSHSTHWRATCNLNNFFKNLKFDMYENYARAKFSDFDLLTFTGYGVCKKMEYINIRGNHCIDCTATWYAVPNKYATVFDSSYVTCQFKPKGGVHSEDNFGYYGTKNKKFDCTKWAGSTTNWWFGGYM